MGKSIDKVGNAPPPQQTEVRATSKKAIGLRFVVGAALLGVGICAILLAQNVIKVGDLKYLKDLADLTKNHKIIAYVASGISILSGLGLAGFAIHAVRNRLLAHKPIQEPPKENTEESNLKNNANEVKENPPVGGTNPNQELAVGNEKDTEVKTAASKTNREQRMEKIEKIKEKASPDVMDVLIKHAHLSYSAFMYKGADNKFHALCFGGGSVTLYSFSDESAAAQKVATFNEDNKDKGKIDEKEAAPLHLKYILRFLNELVQPPKEVLERLLVLAESEEKCYAVCNVKNEQYQISYVIESDETSVNYCICEEKVYPQKGLISMLSSFKDDSSRVEKELVDPKGKEEMNS